MKSICCQILLLLLLFVFGFTNYVFAITSLTYQYDANGNLISGDGKHYEYNDANQLVRVRHGDQNGPVIAEYFYDYTGQRIKKIENGVTTYYIGKHYETQVDGGIQTNNSYYFANGERVAKKDTLGNIYYYHLDHLGGTNVITDSSGNLVERTKYYPFGEIREGGNEKYSFTGKEKDKLTDFYYFEARYYNPEFEHFTQADTFAPNLYDPQDLNRYSYVRNNPIKLIDPTGHVWWKPWTWFKKSDKVETPNSKTQDNSTKTASNSSPEERQCNSVVCRSYTDKPNEKQTYIRAPSQEERVAIKQAELSQALIVDQYRGDETNAVKSPEKVVEGSGKTVQGLSLLGGGIVAATPGLSVAAGGVALLPSCPTVAGCVAGVTTIGYGLAAATPGIAAMVKGGFQTLEGVGDIYSGFTGKMSPFDDPLDLGRIPWR
jgi:RHS repeat-associated protein